MSNSLKAGLARLAVAVTAKPIDKNVEAAAEAKTDDAIHCPSCGSAGPWTILDMNLKVHDVPCTKLSKTGDGHAYDDTKGDSEGWDYIGDSQVKCNKCGNEADVNELIELASDEGVEEVIDENVPVEQGPQYGLEENPLPKKKK